MDARPCPTRTKPTASDRDKSGICNLWQPLRKRKSVPANHHGAEKPGIAVFNIMDRDFKVRLLLFLHTRNYFLKRRDELTEKWKM